MAEVTSKQTEVKKGWKGYNTGDINTAIMQFALFSADFDYRRALMEILMQEQERKDVDTKVEFIVAPYNAMGQLAWFSQDKPFVHAIYGGEETLLFNVPRLINFLDFASDVFYYIEKNDLLTTLKVSQDLFLDIGILSGNCFYSPPKAIQCFQGNRFEQVRQAIEKFGSGISFLMTIQEPLEEFSRVKALISHHVVYTSRCSTFILNKKKCPVDFIDVIGRKLPDEIYFFVALGIISPEILNPLIHKIYREPFVYYDFALHKNTTYKYLLNIIEKTLSLVAQDLDPDFSKQDIAILRYNAQNVKGSLTISPVSTGKLAWKIVENDVVDRLKKDMKSRADYHFVTNYITKAEKQNTIKSGVESLPFVLIKSLEHLNYFENDEFNSFGKALSQSKLYPEITLLLIELARAELLNSNPIATIPTREGNPDEILYIALISKVFALLPMKLNDNAWQYPLNQDLTQWHVITSQFASTIRNLHEAVLMTSFLNKTLEIKNEHLFHISKRIPYFKDTNVTMGVIAAFILEKDIPLKELSIQFPNCLDPIKDITKGMEFWAQTVQIFKTQLAQFTQLNKEFALADEYLSKKIASLQK